MKGVLSKPDVTSGAMAEDRGDGDQARKRANRNRISRSISIFGSRPGDATTVSSAWITIAQASARYALSGGRGIPRAKSTAARADGLVTELGGLMRLKTS